MRIANIRELKLETKRVLGWMARDGPVLITRRGKPVAILRGLEAGEWESRFDSLWNRLRIAAERAGYSSGDISRLIGSVRSRKR